MVPITEETIMYPQAMEVASAFKIVIVQYPEVVAMKAFHHERETILVASHHTQMCTTTKLWKIALGSFVYYFYSNC